MASDHELYYGDFEQDGEEVVRNRVVLGQYQNQKRALAIEWLAQLDQARKDAAQAEQTTLARRAAEAAESAAASAKEAVAVARTANRHADKANAIAMTASAVAIIAVIVSVLSWASQHR